MRTPFALDSPMATKAQMMWNKIAALTVCDLARKHNPAPVTNVVIQKLMFLTELEGRRIGIKSAYYRFYKFKYGPFSTALSWDIADLEKGKFIDSESGEILDRGHYLLELVQPEIFANPMADKAFESFGKIQDSWKNIRGWDIVDKIYQVKVPVDQLQSKMFIGDIPLKTDILIPEDSTAEEFMPLSQEMIEDLEEEFKIPASALDRTTDEFRKSVSDLYHEALAI